MHLPLLSDIEIQRELNALEGWSRKGETIAKTYEFATFPDAIAWVSRVADAAEAANHHPDFDIRFKVVSVSLATEESGGVTSRDFALARAMDVLAKLPDEEGPDRLA
jgi:4a-hydroxytetrahydrobiopterin dehydratase